MSKFNLPRWPYSHDRFFSALALIVFFVPLAFSLKTHENFETVKLCLFFVLLGWAGLEFLKQNQREVANQPEGLQGNTGKFSNVLSRGFVLLLSAVVVFAGFSLVFSPNFIVSFFGLYSRYTGGFLFLLAWSVFVLFLGSALNRDKLTFVGKILVLDGLLMAIYGLLQSVGIGFYSGPDTASIIRSPSFAGNPNFSAMFLAAVLPVICVLFFKSQKMGARIYYALCGFFAIWAIIFFSSRGAFLSLAVSGTFMCVLGLLKRQNRKFGWLMLFSGLITLILFVIFIGFVRPQLVKQTLALNDTNTSLRLYVWDIASRAIISHPVVGVGLGDFLDFYESSAGKNLAPQAQAFDDPHNLFLYQASAGGLPFAIMFLLLLLSGVWQAAKSFLKSGDSLFLGLAGGILAWYAAAAFNPVSVSNYIILAPLLAGAYWREGEIPAKKSGRAIKYFIPLFSVFLLIYGLSLITAEHIFTVGFNAYFKGDFARANKYLKLASRTFPFNPTYNLYALGARIKVEKDSPEVLKALESYNKSPYLTEALKAGNLNFILYLETRKAVYGTAAVNSLMRAMAINPNFSDPYIRAGFFSEDLGLSKQAMVFLNNGLSLNPSAFPGWMLKAKIHQAGGERLSMVYSLQQVAKVYTEDNQLKRMIYVAQRADNIQAIPIQIGANYDKLE